MSNRPRLFLFALLVLAAAWAWYNRFFQDDAYISLVYARNWVEGHGLVFNPGERVEGYTNFLWTVLLALPLRLGWDPVVFSQIVGICCFIGTLLLTYRLARVVSNQAETGLYAVALLGANYTFRAFATGGLETQLQTMLITAVLTWTFAGPAHNSWSPGACAVWSGLAALAVLTRLDSAVLLLVPGLLVLWAERRDTRAIAALLLVFALPVGAWLAWKWSYYGALLPNTVHAKVVGLPLLRGAWYVALFFLTYLLIVPLAFDLAALRKVWREHVAFGGSHDPAGRARSPLRAVFWRRRDSPPYLDATQGRRTAQPNGVHPATWPLFCQAHLPMALWLIYVVAVGGDFMEFRFLVPALPLLMVLFAVAMGASRLRYAVLAVLVAASCAHARFFTTMPWKLGLSSVPDLRKCVVGETGWPRIGEMLSQTFHDMPGLRMAMTPAGAIPYYSRLPVLDMLGLNEPEVARHGALLSDRAGHRRIATIAYLRAQGVNLVIAHPTLVPRNAGPPTYHLHDERMLEMFLFRGMPDPESLPANARMLAIPFTDDKALLVIYLTPRADLDARIASRGWQVTPLDHD